MEGPESENAGQEMKKIRLFGVDIYPFNTNKTAARKTKTPELIDFLSTRDCSRGKNLDLFGQRGFTLVFSNMHVDVFVYDFLISLILEDLDFKKLLD